MMKRAGLILLALVWLALGMLLILAPWLEVWQANYFVYAYPSLGQVMTSPYTRGAITGLGVLDVLLSLEALRQWTSTVTTRS
ncbi:MAG TPA: hypothetical protein VNK23_00435 [Candidatus Dormibacteraeota bacterium]|nr:hypothetical protein [Candidatus Dormibacteraeota bacterium]